MEEKVSNNFSWKDVPKAIWYFLDKDRPRYLVLNIILFVVLFYNLIPPLILGKIVDFFAGYSSGQSLTAFYWYCIFLGVTHALASYVRLYSKRSLSRIAIAARARARISGFERLVNLPLFWHAKENTGNKIERIFSGSQAITGWTSFANNTLFHIAVSFAGVLGAFLFLSPIFVLFLLLYLILFFRIEYYFNQRIAALTRAINTAKQRASGRYIEGSGNILAIKALGAEQGMHAHVRQSEEQTKKLYLEKNLAGTNKWIWFQTLNGLSYGFFALMVGFQVVHGAISIGMILVFFTYFNNLRGSASDASDMSGQMIEMKADLASMMPIFQETANVQTGHEAFPAKHDLVITNGTFTYPSGQIGLERINFSLHQGEKLGVAGLSGSGKSSLVKVLLGLYPIESGAFTIGGVSYYAIEHEEVIGKVAVVLQETELFNMSLQENIVLMRDLNEEQLEQAIEISQLGWVIKQLPEGLNTMIGEKGYKLSGGERQRLGIARAIYKNSPIIILDEATSSLDSHTEKEILDRLLTAFAGDKTVLIIAHRISTLQNTDRVVFFEKGKIVEEGLFHGLIENPHSKLGELYMLQKSSKV